MSIDPAAVVTQPLHGLAITPANATDPVVAGEVRSQRLSMTNSKPAR